MPSAYAPLSPPSHLPAFTSISMPPSTSRPSRHGSLNTLATPSKPPASPTRQQSGYADSFLAPTQAEDLSLEDLRRLTDVEEIQRHLRRLNEVETTLDLDLDGILRDRKELEKELDTLDVLRPQIGILRHDANSLVVAISDTSKLAERISDKVRQLDLEQSRVKDTIKQVEDIQQLKKCASGAQQALKSKDYELAAQHISQYLAFDPVMIENIFAGDAGDNLYFIDSTATPDADVAELSASVSPLEMLKTAQRDMTNVAIDEFDNAVQKGDEDQIVRFFKIFPVIGQHDIGLDKFAAYICGIISRQCQDAMKQPSDNVPRFYAGLLTRLFETIAMVVDRQTGLVQSAYGPGRMLTVIQRLQRQADIQSSIILESFSEKYQLPRKMHEINLLEGRRPAGAPKPESTIDAKEIDVILNEMAVMSQRAQLFDRFLHMRAEEEVEKRKAAKTDGNASSAFAVTEGNGLVKVSKLNERIQELMGNFVAMEEFFIRRSIEKAMKIEEHEKGSLISSIVDDAFYILRNSTTRAMSTGDPDCVCAIINGMGRILEVDYITTFQKRLSAAFSTTDTRDSKMSFMFPLNNIDVSCDYIVKLTQELESEIPRAFGTSSELSQEKIRSCLAGLSEYAGNFRNVVKTWIENLFNQTIKPRLRPLLQQAYDNTKYVLNEDEYAEQEASDAFVKRYANGFGKMIGLYQKSYTENNYNQTIVLAIDYIAKDWERFLLANHKFNQASGLFGALRFDKDLRSLSSYLSSQTPWTTRDKFARLNQMSTLLNLESLDEVQECLGGAKGGGGAVTWRLTANEVRKVLAMRVDFKAEDITKLKL
ncbi:Golgi transport complex subunit 4 [Borealophlyctis nickersoniae]|nr:Golgi transport complex subunit 4 [Borealophlyctis nickersoniae]